MFVFSCSDGIFFAVKEVSLLDEGSTFQLLQVLGLNLPIKLYNIYSLFSAQSLQGSIWLNEYFWSFFQEISLLSQFEHKNIVLYLGTDKVYAILFKLYDQFVSKFRELHMHIEVVNHFSLFGLQSFFCLLNLFCTLEVNWWTCIKS